MNLGADPSIETCRGGEGLLRILLLQRSKKDVEIILGELREAGFALLADVVSTSGQFRRKLLGGTHDMVLAGYRLRGWNGLEALEMVKRSGKDIPFLLVTGTLGEEAAAECIEKGVTDYVLKQHLSRLPFAVRRALREKSLRDDHARSLEALRNSEASFRLLFADNPLPMWVYDHETLRFLQVNDAAIEHYGYSREEFLHMTLRDIRPPEDVPILLGRLREHPVPTARAGPWRHRQKGGRIIHVDIAKHALEFEGREAVLVVVVDVTDRLRAEAALRESEARARQQLAELDLFYRTAPIGLALVDSNFRYVRVNEELAAINGRPAPEHIGKTIRDMVPEMADKVEPVLRRAMEWGETILHLEAQGTTAAQPGVERYWLTNYLPLRSADGRVMAVSIVVLEITESKQAAEALLRLEARNRDLVENAIYGIFRATPEGRLLDVNPALVRMLGYSSVEELRAKNLALDIYRFPQQHAAILATVREQGRVVGAEKEWRRKDGTFITVRLTERLVAADEHGEGSLEIIAEDVTELRAMEKHLRLVQKIEAIGQLAGGIAHDFNNVVGAILGWSEIGMEQARQSPQLLEHFAKIREQADRAAALTRQLLAFARQQILEPRPIDLNQTVAGLMSFLEKVIGTDIELKVVSAQPLDLVRADPTQIEQVVMNLCLNARDAMPQGGRLVIETEVAELDESYCRHYTYAVPGRYAVLSVSDTGIGMDAATRERIFEPFFTTKEVGKGTGLGLATVYGIVKQHGGFIHVYSEPSHGTLFRVYLPAIADSGRTDDHRPASRFPAALPRGTETILVAEDHDSVREMVCQTLVSLGYRVLAAANGEEALRLCEKERPALAILDVMMPKLGGPAAYAQMSLRNPQLPVIFTTGYSAELASLDTQANTGHDLLQKPYSPGALGRKVREVLDRAGASIPR